MMSLKKISFHINKPLFIFLGFFFCQNIMYFSKIGNTYININVLIMAICLVLIVINNFHNLHDKIRKIPIIYLISVACIFLSIISSLYLNFKLDISMSAFYNGIVFYIFCSIIPLIIGIFLERNEFKNIILGFLIGYMTNCIIVILNFLSFKLFNFSFSFSTLFPRHDFFEPNYWCSGQGLFLEPSHFSGFLMISFYFLFWFYKSNKIRIILTLTTWICFIIYGRGNLPIFIISQIIFLFLLFWKRIYVFACDYHKKNPKRFIFYFLLIAIVIALIFLFLFIKYKNKILDLLDEINPFSDKNADRFNSIKYSFDIFLKHPFGVGFNMLGPTMAFYHESDVTQLSVHSFLIRVLVERGIIGTLIFFLSLIYIFCKAYKNISDFRILFMSILFGLIYSFLNGPMESYFYFIIGVCTNYMSFDSKNVTFWTKDKALVTNIKTIYGKIEI